MGSTFRKVGRLATVAATLPLTACAISHSCTWGEGPVDQIVVPPGQGLDGPLGLDVVPPDQASGSLPVPPSQSLLPLPPIPPLADQRKPVVEDPAIGPALDDAFKMVKKNVADKCQVSDDVVERARYVVGGPVQIEMPGGDIGKTIVTWKAPDVKDPVNYLSDPKQAANDQRRFTYSTYDLFSMADRIMIDAKLVGKPGPECARAGIEFINMSLATGIAMEKMIETLPPQDNGQKLPSPLPALPVTAARVRVNGKDMS
jgi:hypothetical protein